MAILSEAARLGPLPSSDPEEATHEPFRPSSGPMAALAGSMGSRLSGEPAVHRARSPRSLPDGRARGEGACSPAVSVL